MSKRLAYIFPGQGSQFSGMGSELAEKYPASREVFEEADEALGFSISNMCFRGTSEELQLTENTQPAILTTSIATLRALAAEGIPAPDFVAGHSLGEYSALVAAGAISLADAVRTVNNAGSHSGTSSQRRGVDTRASGFARTEYADATVRSFAFWL